MQDPTVLWKLLATAVFVVLNGFFVAAEFGLVKVRPIRIAALAQAGDRRAVIVQRMLLRLDLYLSACQLGITIASLVLGWLAEPAVARLLIEPRRARRLGSPRGRGPSLGGDRHRAAVITILHMTVGEQAPKVWRFNAQNRSLLLDRIPAIRFATALDPSSPSSTQSPTASRASLDCRFRTSTRPPQASMRYAPSSRPRRAPGTSLLDKGQSATTSWP